MLARLLFAVLVLASGAAQAGYGYGVYCWGTLNEAVAVYAKVNWNATSIRILSYTPTTGNVQVVFNNNISAMSILPCDLVNTTDMYGATPTPWYGSDPGTVSACGSPVSPAGGVTGSGGASVAPLTEEQKTALFNDGKEIGWGLSLIAIVAFVIRKMGGAFT